MTSGVRGRWPRKLRCKQCWMRSVAGDDTGGRRAGQWCCGVVQEMQGCSDEGVHWCRGAVVPGCTGDGQVSVVHRSMGLGGTWDGDGSAVV